MEKNNHNVSQFKGSIFSNSLASSRGVSKGELRGLEHPLSKIFND